MQPKLGCYRFFLPWLHHKLEMKTWKRDVYTLCLSSHVHEIHRTREITAPSFMTQYVVPVLGGDVPRPQQMPKTMGSATQPPQQKIYVCKISFY